MSPEVWELGDGQRIPAIQETVLKETKIPDHLAYRCDIVLYRGYVASSLITRSPYRRLPFCQRSRDRWGTTNVLLKNSVDYARTPTV